MFGRRTPRFAVEVLVLVALAVSLTLAQLNRLAIAGVMLLGWLICSLLEWASLRGEAHYGAGLPPRYYVPQVRLPPPLTTAESVVRRSASAPPVEMPVPVEVPVPAVAPVVEMPAPVVAPVVEEPAEPLAPAAFVSGTEQIWEPVQAPVVEQQVVAPVEPVVEHVAAPVEPLWEPVVEPEPVEIPQPVADLTEYEELPVEATADDSWFADGIPGEVEFMPAPELELTPGPEAGVEAPGAIEPEVEVEVEVGFAESHLEEEAVVEAPQLPPPIPATWFDSQLPAPAAPVESALEPELIEEPAVELPEPMVLEPVAAFELPPAPAPALEIEPELEEEAVLEPLPELPVVSASWFDAQLPGGSATVEPELEPAGVEPELAEEPVLELPEPIVEEPVAAIELPEPELDLELLAGEPLPEEPGLVSWFDAQLPGAPAPSEPALPVWAVVDSEPEAEREDEWAAQETLAEELEPLLEVPSHEGTPVDLDLDVPVGEPLPDEPTVVSWFDPQLPGIVISEPGTTEPEWLSGPEAFEQQIASAADSAAELHVEEMPPAPTVSLEPDAELELDLFIERLAGERLGEDASLVSWFDAQLPGAVAPSEVAGFVGRTQGEDQGVGGWVVEQAPAAWPTSDPALAAASEGVDYVWEPDIAMDENTGVMEAVAYGPDMTARHSIDPLAGFDSSKGRLWGREHAEGGATHTASIDVPARPVGKRLLPGRTNRDT
jgi:hypothetical protein